MTLNTVHHPSSPLLNPGSLRTPITQASHGPARFDESLTLVDKRISPRVQADRAHSQSRLYEAQSQTRTTVRHSHAASDGPRTAQASRHSQPPPPRDDVPTNVERRPKPPRAGPADSRANPADPTVSSRSEYRDLDTDSDGSQSSERARTTPEPEARQADAVATDDGSANPATAQQDGLEPSQDESENKTPAEPQTSTDTPDTVTATADSQQAINGQLMATEAATPTQTLVPTNQASSPSHAGSATTSEPSQPVGAGTGGVLEQGLSSGTEGDGSVGGGSSESQSGDKGSLATGTPLSGAVDDGDEGGAIRSTFTAEGPNASQPTGRGVSASSPSSVHPIPATGQEGSTLASNATGPSNAAATATSEAQAPSGQPGPEDVNTARVMRGIRNAVKQNGGAVTLRLSPAQLGLVRIQVQIDQGTVVAQLLAEQDSARSLLQQQLGQLRQALETHGLTVDKIDVQSLPQDTNKLGQEGDRSHHDSPADGRSRGHLNQSSKDKQETNDQQSQAKHDEWRFEKMLNEVG